jgi:ribosomal protein L3 glutamine methyltransferase
MGPEATTPRSLVLDAERRFREAGLVYGHGTGDARDDAVFLVFHALAIPFDATDAELDAPLSPVQVARVGSLVRQRIETRTPAAYLTGRMWFAGHEFTVNEHVLIPRSPIAELIENRFKPWIDPGRLRRVLDIGTGSACIAVAVALRFRQAVIEATDISADALKVAQRNVRRHGLEGRVFLIRTDLYPPTTGVYDVIVSNPPYVPRADLTGLPDEYQRERTGRSARARRRHHGPRVRGGVPAAVVHVGGTHARRGRGLRSDRRATRKIKGSES